jgi:hypothetical protein
MEVNGNGASVPVSVQVLGHCTVHEHLSTDKGMTDSNKKTDGMDGHSKLMDFCSDVKQRRTTNLVSGRVWHQHWQPKRYIRIKLESQSDVISMTACACVHRGCQGTTTRLFIHIVGGGGGGVSGNHNTLATLTLQEPQSGHSSLLLSIPGQGGGSAVARQRSRKKALSHSRAHSLSLQQPSHSLSQQLSSLPVAQLLGLSP